MSSDWSIRVAGLGKRYDIYPTPRARLKQLVIPPVQRLVGRTPSTYGRVHWALKDINFEILKGEAFGVLGRNGSGKSTLLQLITGTLSPTEGIVEKRGRVAALLELGSGFNPEFTGRDNVYLNAMLLGMGRQEVEARFDKIAGFADIGSYLDQPVKTYSSGMLVRLAFAVQVQIDPDILIVDEALAVGDALFQKRCYERIEKLRSDGVTLLFVSHDQEAVRTLTNRAVLLHRGRQVMVGNASQALLSYRRLLHDEEMAQFSQIAGSRNAAPPSSKVQEQQSFGEGGIEVVAVATFNASDEPCALFYPNETIRIRVECESSIETDKINVAVRIRNREGIKMYSWGTLNQDIQVLNGRQTGDVFWSRLIRAGERFHVWLECACTLGPNLYEVQASVSYEGRPDYTAQRMLHWRDEAAFFQTQMRPDEYFFGGMADLRMVARW